MTISSVSSRAASLAASRAANAAQSPAHQKAHEVSAAHRARSEKPTIEAKATQLVNASRKVDISA